MTCGVSIYVCKKGCESSLALSDSSSMLIAEDTKEVFIIMSYVNNTY